jgi:hypothetical protein
MAKQKNELAALKEQIREWIKATEAKIRLIDEARKRGLKELIL